MWVLVIPSGQLPTKIIVPLKPAFCSADIGLKPLLHPYIWNKNIKISAIKEFRITILSNYK